jgi:hypothetical protein
MAQRAHYWSCSKFARWVSTTFGAPPKLRSGTSEEWAAWRRDVRRNHPAVYCFTEKFLNAAQNFICWPYDKICDARYYLFTRYVSKTHYMKTGLPPGQYYEFEKRLLHGIFNELVDFIEVEKAYHHCMWSEEKRAQYQFPWWRGGWRCLRWGIWRCSEAGLDYLEWESQLKFDDEWLDKADPRYDTPTPQAVAAIEQKRLYDWWKNVRPNRPDPYDESGWSEFCERRRSTHADKDDDLWPMLFNDKTDEERAISKRLMEVMDSIEKSYDDEDEAMMISLIKVRQSLWA